MINPERWRAAHDQDIATVCTELGIDVRGGRARCPFHTDRTPSFSIWKRNLAHCFLCAATNPKDGTWDPVRLVHKVHEEMSRYEALLFVERLFGLPALSDVPGGDAERSGRRPRAWIHQSFDRLRLTCIDCLEKRAPGSEKCLDYLEGRRLDMDIVLATGAIGAVPNGLDVAPIIEAAKDLFAKYPLQPLFTDEEMAKAPTARREKMAEIEQERQRKEQERFEHFAESLRQVPGYAGMLALFYEDGNEDFVHAEFVSGRGRERKIYAVKPDRSGVFAPRIAGVSASKKRPVLFVVEGWANLVRLWSEQARIARAAGKDWEQCLWDGVALGSAADWDGKAVISMLDDCELSLAVMFDKGERASAGAVEKLNGEISLTAFCAPEEWIAKDLDECFDEAPPEPIVRMIEAGVDDRANYFPRPDEGIREDISKLRHQDGDAIDTAISIKDYLHTLLNREGSVFNDGYYAHVHDRATLRTWRLDDGDFCKYVFSERFGLTRSGLQKAVFESLGLKILHESERVVTHSFAFYDRKAFAAYLNFGAFVLKIPPDSLERQENGQEGVYFFGDPLPEEKRLDLAKASSMLGAALRCGLDLRLRLPLVEGLKACYDESSGVPQWGYEFLFLAKYVSLFLPELFTRRNIAFITSPPGRGKTFIASKVGWLVMGEKFAPQVFSEAKKDQLETLLTNSQLVLLDNFDSGSKANQSLLCQACTTGAVSMRALYQTNKLVSYPVLSELYMTGLCVPPNFRNDLQNRLLEFPVLPFPQDGKSETQRQEEFLASRPALIAETVARLQLVLRAERAEAKLGARYWTRFRIKDFGLFLLRQAHYGGFFDQAEALLERVVERQRQNVIEGTDISPLLALLVAGQGGAGREMSATFLCSKLDEMASALRPRNPFSGNARGLGKFLRENADEFAARFGLVVGSHNGDHSAYSFRPGEEQLDSLRRQLGLEGIRDPADVVAAGKAWEVEEEQWESEEEDSDDEERGEADEEEEIARGNHGQSRFSRT